MSYIEYVMYVYQVSRAEAEVVIGWSITSLVKQALIEAY